MADSPARRELAAAQQAGEAKTPAGARARKQARALLATHAGELFGPLAAYPGDRWGGLNLVWRRGYIDAASIDCKYYDRASFAEQKVDALACLDDLLAHPSASQLRELAFARIDADETDYAPVIARIAARELPQLRRLVIGPDSGYGGPVGDVEPLWRACPNLEHLAFPIAGTRRVDFARISLPHLVTLEIMAPTPRAIAAVASAKWPALAELRLRPDEEPALDVGDLRPLLAGRAVPELRKLAFEEYRPADALCEALAASALARQLVELEIVLSDATDAGALALAAATWPKLKRLDLGDNAIGKAGRQAVKAMRVEVKV